MISPGDIIEDRYRVHKLHARRDLGCVFLGESLQTGKQVVIKTVPADLLSDASHQKHVQSLFFRESQTLSALSNPGIPYLFGTGTLRDGSPYLVMEFIEGQNLDHILAASGRVDISVALDLAEALASILGTIHAAGFVHRDIKPTNTLIPGQISGAPDFTNPTLVGFGLAKRIKEQESARRQPEIVGTPYYLAPELFTGSDPSPASDIYSLGVLLYQVVFGVLPFGGRTATDLFQRVLSDQLDIPANVPMPHAVVKFLRQCLSRNPADRPSSGNAAANEIGAVRAQFWP
jgi:serine/threonine-protein kinase